MTDGSVTHWIGQVKHGGGDGAEEELWERYFARLAALARSKLQDLPPSVRDDEDLALSALNSFFLRAKQGEFSRLQDRTDLWRLLAKITVRKAIDRRRKAQAQKRWTGQPSPALVDDVHSLVAQGPTPDVLAAMSEECDRLLGALKADLQCVARMKLEGYTNAEIATKLGRVERTVERKLERIRVVWSGELDES